MLTICEYVDTNKLFRLQTGKRVYTNALRSSFFCFVLYLQSLAFGADYFYSLHRIFYRELKNSMHTYYRALSYHHFVTALKEILPYKVNIMYFVQK